MGVLFNPINVTQILINLFYLNYYKDFVFNLPYYYIELYVIKEIDSYNFCYNKKNFMVSFSYYNKDIHS